MSINPISIVHWRETVATGSVADNTDLGGFWRSYLYLFAIGKTTLNIKCCYWEDNSKYVMYATTPNSNCMLLGRRLPIVTTMCDVTADWRLCPWRTTPNTRWLTWMWTNNARNSSQSARTRFSRWEIDTVIWLYQRGVKCSPDLSFHIMPTTMFIKSRDPVILFI